MSLTEFLLARISEDEQVVQHALDEAHREGEDSTGHELVHHPSAVGDAVVAVSPDRAMQECAAKRRIIQLMGGLAAPGPNGNGSGRSPADDVLTALALPYADHEDFQQEWAAASLAG
jgi:hypothetical protein